MVALKGYLKMLNSSSKFFNNSNKKILLDKKDKMKMEMLVWMEIRV